MPFRSFHALPRHIAILFIVVLTVMVFPHAKSWSQTKADDWDWMREHFQSAFTDLLPIKQDVGMYIGYRSHRDLYTEVLEYSFVIEYHPKEVAPGQIMLTSAHVRQADSVSIYDQMMKLHHSNPQENAASIQKKVKLKTWDLTEAACPALGTQFAKFQQLSIRTPSFEELHIHPLVHEFHITALAGDMDLDLVDNDAPLVKWAIETRSALENCVAAPHHAVSLLQFL